MLTELEERQLVDGWSHGEPTPVVGPLVDEMFEARAERAPAAIALVSGQETMTYRRLNARANRLAHHLRICGVGPDVLVAVCFER